MNYDFLVVGCGIVGLTTAIAVRKAFGGTVCVIEKEETIGAHASGRNSGVLHAGIYYKPGTLKARLCVEGNRLIREYCASKGIKSIKGKVIVAREERDLPALFKLERRAKACRAEVKLIDEKELKEIEPYALTCRKALYSPNTAVIDPKEVLGSLAEDARSLGVEIRLGARLLGLGRGKKEAVTTGGRLGYGFLVNAAGAYADRIAHMCGLGLSYTMVPYKGIYLKLKDEYGYLVRSNIYPVPDARYPFLGVHLTRTPHGTVKIGPTAIPALSRENYGMFSNLRYSELAESAACTARKLLTDKNYVSLALREIGKYLPYLMYREAKKLLPSLQYTHIARHPVAGIRPQLFDKSKNELVMDYLILQNDDSLHILNAVSPAFTSSLAFAEYVVERMGRF